MKRRLILLSISLFLVFTLFLVGLFFGETYIQRILFAVSLISLSFLGVYIFFGIGKLIVILIYGMVLSILLVFLPNYDLALIFIGTFIIALNPLYDFESFITKNMPEEKSAIDYLKGSYRSYYNYRKEIKEQYHFPQVRKTYIIPWYLKVRQGLTIVLSMLAIFLLIREVNNLISVINDFDIHLFFASTYSVVGLMLLTVMLYKKGFQSTLNLLTVIIFPPIIYSLFLVKPSYLGIILGIVALFFGLASAVYQYIAYRNRIIFESFHYYDPEKQAEVYANALFEKYVYDENFYLSTTFNISIEYSEFVKIFESIYIFSDWHRFFITAYTVKKGQVTIYTDFHHSNYLLIDKFKQYLEKITLKNVLIKVTEDKDKVFYETNFFHQNNYIIARAVYLANLAKQVNINGDVVISFIAYFVNIDNIVKMNEKYEVIRLPELDLDDALTTRINVRSNNVDYVIENRVQEFLLDLLIYQGKFVRINVFY